MWSNDFYRTIDLALSPRAGSVLRLFGGRIRTIRAHGSGRWSLRLAPRAGGDAEWIEVRLTHGWIGHGGQLLGLRWVAGDGRVFACCLWCLHARMSAWRRLLVRLRVPMAPGLA